VPGLSKITNDGLTRSGTGCFIAVPVWQQWVSKCWWIFMSLFSVWCTSVADRCCSLHHVTWSVLYVAWEGHRVLRLCCCTVYAGWRGCVMTYERLDTHSHTYTWYALYLSSWKNCKAWEFPAPPLSTLPPTFFLPYPFRLHPFPAAKWPLLILARRSGECWRHYEPDDYELWRLR